MGKVESDGLHHESYLVTTSLLLVEAGLVKSRSEARRLITQGAVDVEIDDNTITETDDYCRVKLGSIIKVGKRRWLRLVGAD